MKKGGCFSGKDHKPKKVVLDSELGTIEALVCEVCGTFLNSEEFEEC